MNESGKTSVKQMSEANEHLALDTIKRYLALNKQREASIEFRLQTCRAFRHSRLTISEFCKRVGLSRSRLYNWINQYDAGLYNLDSTTRVSASTKANHTNLLDSLINERDLIDEKIKVIRRAQELGLTIV